MLRGGLVKIEHTWRCRWCARVEKKVALWETADGFMRDDRHPEGWVPTAADAHRPSLCSSDCKKEYAEATARAHSTLYKRIADETTLGDGEAAYSYDEFEKAVEKLRLEAMQTRKEKFL